MSCGCSSNSDRLIYACSGAANTGLLSDQVARRLTLRGTGRMTCLAGLGADLDSFVQSARTAKQNLVLDGCPVSCGRKAFERLGLTCEALVLTEFGVEKGKTAITEPLIAGLADRIAQTLEPHG